MVNNDLHFKESNLIFLKLILFLSISIMLLALDKDLSTSNKIRFNISYLIEPFYKLAELPINIYDNLSEYSNNKNELIEENKRLRKKVLVQSGIIQNIPSLKEENKRLKKLLASQGPNKSSRILIAELIKINLSPFSNKIVINKGKKENLFIGQTVIDSKGILGQVSELNEDFSIVTLITDPGHALLGINPRTDKKIVISGTGDNRVLQAEFISLNEDVKEGDYLITSGLDNIFPEGYLIGEITKIKKDEDEDFLNVKVSPSSSLSFNREVMLLW